jgi:hypothetical protein
MLVAGYLMPGRGEGSVGFLKLDFPVSGGYHFGNRL